MVTRSSTRTMRPAHGGHEGPARLVRAGGRERGLVGRVADPAQEVGGPEAEGSREVAAGLGVVIAAPEGVPPAGGNHVTISRGGLVRRTSARIASTSGRAAARAPGA